MLISKGDLVRPNNINLGLPLWSLWRVLSTIGGLKLYPYGSDATAVKHLGIGLRFKPEDFTRQTMNTVGEWVDELPLPAAGEVMTECMSSSSPSIKGLPKTVFANSDVVTTATTAAEQASLDSAHCARLLEAARKREAERQQELREAKAAKAKADKEAAARAKVEEARKALSARLHADRLLALDTLALIGEVAWLNNGGAERPAPVGIANHADQLQPLARSYGYRIVKPSNIALVVKL